MRPAGETNGQLAKLARARADQHPGGSLERRAWCCVAVALSLTKTVPAARRVLDEIPVPAVRAAAPALFAQLVDEPSPTTAPLPPTGPSPDRSRSVPNDSQERRCFEMSGEELAVAIRRRFERFARRIVDLNEDHLCNDGPDEQVTRAVQSLEHFHATTPILPIPGTVIDLAGFGEAPVHFAHFEDDAEPAHQYLLLSEVAEQLGVPVWKACDWARQQHLWAIEDQRHTDEERGDGRLGYDLLRGYVDLQLDFIAENPEAKPDADGRRWSSYGDWLISDDRLLAFISVSPWGPEFMNNVMPSFSHAMRKLHGEKLSDVQAVDADGNPTGATGFDLFDTQGLTEEEALRRARRGPTLDIGDAGDR